MDFSAKVLGSNTVAYLRSRQTAPVLTIGKNTYTRADLSEVACFTFMAAANLSKVLKRLQVPNTRFVFESVSPEALALPGLGAVSLAVLGAVFEMERLGGNTPLESWVKRHLPDKTVVTFTTMKLRDDKERAEERKTRRQRKAQRRDKAHRLRKERFTTQGSTHVHQ